MMLPRLEKGIGTPRRRDREGTRSIWATEGGEGLKKSKVNQIFFRKAPGVKTKRW